MSEILWQYHKIFGTISFRLRVETVNRFTNYGNYAKGSVYLNGIIVTTLWYPTKEECQICIEEHKLVCKFFSMIDPSDFSLIEMQYLLDPLGEFDKFSQLIRFQTKTEIKKFLFEDHYECTFFSGGEIAMFSDVWCILEPSQNEYVLQKVEIVNDANILKVNYHLPRESVRTKTITLSPYFYKCIRLALIFNALYEIENFRNFNRVSFLPSHISAGIYSGMNNFVNNYCIYSKKV